ncbi:uncharacterized protein LOC131992187 [Centropristis striata]|uniref:uncharacterized protein LOC131992187 n=1 Tax=Centropristis striata TaxID=184440 RepID=UPI0027DEBCFE|nr:uncharacterized protein LOC131992187 [Centropristis striata]
MATVLTQDAVLHYLQVNGGSVKNSDLLLHFKNFIRDHADRTRNRELFKKFVNSVATVKQIDGVSYVVLRKKFKGYVPGSGQGGSTDPTGRSTEPSPEGARRSPAWSTEKPRQREVAAPGPPGVTAGNTVLPAAGIMINNNNNKVETNLNLKQQQVTSTPELSSRAAAAQVVSQISQTPSLSEPPAPDQCTKVGQHRVGSGPPPGVTPLVKPGVTPVVKPLVTPVVKPVVTPGVTPGVTPLVTPVVKPLVTPVVTPGVKPGVTPGVTPLVTPVVKPLVTPVVTPGVKPGVTPGVTPLVTPVVKPLVTPVVKPVVTPGVKPGVTPGVKPGVTAVRHHGETSQQAPVPETIRGREVSFQPERGLHQEPPLHQVNLQPQGAARRMRHRKSYKSAVSYDDDEEEQEENQMSSGSAGGSSSVSSPCIADPPVPPSVVSSSSSSSSERKLPKIYIQDVDEEPLGGQGWSSESGMRTRGQWGGPGPEPVTDPLESFTTRRSLPLEAERYVPSPGPATEVVPHQDVHKDRRYSQPAGVQLEPRQGPSQSQAVSPSYSQSSIFGPSSDSGHPSSDWPPSGSSRGSGWNRSLEDLHTRAGETGRGSTIQGALQRAQGKRLESEALHAKTAPWHHSTGHLLDDQEPTSRLSPFHHSTDHLHDDHSSTTRGPGWHLSTGDLYDDQEDAESSDGSTSSPPLRPRPSVARRLSSKLRSRMCRSLGADLDQLLQEEERATGGSEAARLNRLHMISSSLSLRYNLSSSSLSSCSTPPRSHSFSNLIEGVEGGEGRRSSHTAATSTAPQERPSKQTFPMESREHDWLVKGAAGAWPDIYTLFREDPSLLNRQDFISGFTVLHWIAKHGDHRVLNTLWYGVQKAGLTFDMNAQSACGYTPLHIAAIHGHKNIMKLLVNKFDADVKLRDAAGKKPWQYLSRTTPPEVFQMLGAPARHALGGKEGAGTEESSWEQRQPQRRRKRHHLSFASSGERPLTIAGTIKVKRSSSIAALLKHKSMRRFHRNQSDSFL